MRGAVGLAVALAASLTLPACDGEDRSLRVLAQEEHLARQIEDLQRLVERAERGELVPRDGIVVAVREGLLQEVLRLSLPYEDDVRGGFHVRLEKAEVRLEDGHGTVRLDGRADWMDVAFGFEGDVSAELTVFGRVEVLGADTETGTLRARVVPYGYEIHELRVGEERPRTRRLMTALGRTLPEALSTLSTALTLPVAFEHALRLKGVEAGPVRIAAASVPLRVAVKEAFAHGGRLWVVLQAEPGRWARETR